MANSDTDQIHKKICESQMESETTQGNDRSGARPILKSPTETVKSSVKRKFRCESQQPMHPISKTVN